MPLNSTVNPFSQVPQTLKPRSMFDCSFKHTTTCDGGYLIPAFRDDMLPGDTIDLSVTIFSRLNTQIVPFMDNAYVEFHLWAVPRRLVWSNFKKFMGEKANPGDSIDYLLPTVTVPSGGCLPGSMLNYLGVPCFVDNLTIDASFPRACNLIWNEWYRSEYLQDSLPCPTDDGPDDPSIYKLFRRGKRGDYFTTCLPAPQNGPAVELPIGDTVSVVGSNSGTINKNAATWDSGLVGQPIGISNYVSSGEHYTMPFSLSTGSQGSIATSIGLIADLSSATAVTINNLRQAITMQQYLEQEMRGGTRYIEKVFSFFGVVSPDARLQRPEFLGSFSANLNQNTVAQTSQTTQGSNGSPQANLAAYSTFSVRGNSIKHSFTEHTILIGFLQIRADLSYQYGLDRQLTKRTPFDFAWPTFAHLSEQVVTNGEIFATGTDRDKEPFGYNERYAELRCRNNMITGLMASNANRPAQGDDPAYTSLDVWHLAQKWDKDNPPVLNSEFIEDKPPFERVIAVQNEPQFYVDIDFEYYCTRVLPTYGVPGLTRL